MGAELHNQASNSLPTSETTFDATTFESYYMNQMQILANVIDPNNLYAEVAPCRWQNRRYHRSPHHSRGQRHAR